MKRTILAVLWCAVPAAAHAQQGPPAQQCTYDECALRVRGASFIKPAYIVRGEQDVEVMMLAPFGESTAPIFQRSDSAFAHALRYDRLQPVASVLNIAGPAVLLVAPFLTNWREHPIASLTLMAGGFGMTVYGTHLGNAAMDALGRAIWWHNRDLAERD